MRQGTNMFEKINKKKTRSRKKRSCRRASRGGQNNIPLLCKKKLKRPCFVQKFNIRVRVEEVTENY
jgi:hypothetical protein